MRCGQCQFENMPGLERCFQCGAVLGEQEAIDVIPPRMAGWKKPWRGLRRQFRGVRGGPKKESFPARNTNWDIYESLSFPIAAALSIVPGLGHVIRRRFRNVWWAVLLWAALIAVAILLYGSDYGYWATGIAVGLHAWIAVRWPDEEKLRGLKRLWAMLAMMIVAPIVYYFVFHG